VIHVSLTAAQPAGLYYLHGAPVPLAVIFLTKLAFAADYNTSPVGAAKSSGTFKNLYNKIFTRYTMAIHCLARAEKSRKGKFPCLLNALLGHSAYNYMSQLNEPGTSPALRPTGME